MVLNSLFGGKMSSKIVKNVSIILICSIIAKVLSYFWEAILASYLGVTDQADAFYMTTSIFNILFPILDLGIWKVFLPIYKKKMVKKNEDGASVIANISITLFFVLSVALVIVLLFFSNPIVYIFAPGFNIEKRAITVEYLRLCTPYLLFAAVSSVIGAMLQSHEKFLGSQIREIGTHVSRLFCVVICYKHFGIYAAIIAMIIGSVFRLLIQLPFINWKWRFKPNFNFKDKDIIVMIKGLPSVALTATITHLNGMIDKMVASGAVSGSVACLNYGHKLMNVFSGMISTAIATAAYPTIIQHIAQNNKEKLKELLKNIFCALLFCIIPISLFCFLFSGDLVTVAFQRGAFDSSATAMTSSVFVCYCFGMLFIGLASVITNVFYAYGDTKITMIISIIEIVLNIAFDLLFVNFWGVAGLAFATSISAMICLGIRMIYLKKYIRIGYKDIVKEGLKILLFACIACIIPYFIFNWIFKLNVFISVFVGLIISVVLYFCLAFVFHINTLNFLSSLIGKKIIKKNNLTKNDE